MLSDTLFQKPIALALLFVPFLLIAWIYFDTSYKIEGDKLYYKSGFIRGQLSIESIRKVIKGKTSWSGLRPAIAMNGLLIIINRGSEVYISPEDNDIFIDAIVKMNKEIQVVG